MFDKCYILHVFGCIHLLNTRKYCDNTWKYCGNTHEYWPNTWKKCSPANEIFTSIVTILVRFEAILMYLKACGGSILWNWLLKLILTENLFKIASSPTSIVTILVNIAVAGDHIFQVLAQYSWVLPQYLQVLSQYLRVLSRWIHPRSVEILLLFFWKVIISFLSDKVADKWLFSHCLL